MMHRFLCLVACLCAFSLMAQPTEGAQKGGTKTALSKNFKFKDGVFYSFEAFQRNRPDLSWELLDADVVTNPRTLLTQVASMRLKKNRHELPADSLWGLVIDGIPYIKLSQIAAQKSLPTFAALSLRGKICYFSYETTVKVKEPMSAYNPVNGKAFMTANVEQQRSIKHEQILHFETGEVKNFDVQNLKTWIQDDKGLLETVEDLKGKEISEKLFKCLLIYDDRNPVFLKL